MRRPNWNPTANTYPATKPWRRLWVTDLVPTQTWLDSKRLIQKQNDNCRWLTHTELTRQYSLTWNWGNADTYYTLNVVSISYNPRRLSYWSVTNVTNLRMPCNECFFLCNYNTFTNTFVLFNVCYVCNWVVAVCCCGLLNKSMCCINVYA